MIGVKTILLSKINIYKGY